ncbi:hypothetical protein Q7404_08350 [Glaesserella parasuis]|nr:hypothetical protein [Glaesserella parasuis]
MMKKFCLPFILMSAPMLSVANESLLFSCESDKNNNEFRLIEHTDKLEAEYQVVNKKKCFGFD